MLFDGARDVSSVSLAMKVTRERKIYAAVLGLALLGFTLDRTIFGGSHDAQADAAAQAEAALVPTTAPTASVTPAGDDVPLAARLASAVNDANFDPATIRVPFSAQLPWLAATQIDAPPSSAELFVQKHNLTAVMGSGQSGYAIIDGACVRIGRSLEGFKLTAIDAKSVTFEAGSSRVKLQLRTPVTVND
jgi:hypothetical protein